MNAILDLRPETFEMTDAPLEFSFGNSFSSEAWEVPATHQGIVTRPQRSAAPAIPLGLEGEMNLRRPGSTRDALRPVQQYAERIATRYGLRRNFVLTMLGLALKESLATFARPAGNFNVSLARQSGSPVQWPGGCRNHQPPCISAWGVFQCNVGRWNAIVRALFPVRNGHVVRGRDVQSYNPSRLPWRATREEEIALPIIRAKNIYLEIRGRGGDDIDALRGVILEHEAGGIYRGQYIPPAGTRRTPAEFKEAWQHLHHPKKGRVHPEHYDGILWCVGISTEPDGRVRACERMVVDGTLVFPPAWQRWRQWLPDLNGVSIPTASTQELFENGGPVASTETMGADRRMVDPRKVNCNKHPRSYLIFRAMRTTDPVGVLEAVCRRAVEMLDNTIAELNRVRAAVRAGQPPAFPLVADIVSASLRTRMRIRVDDPRVWAGNGPGSVGLIIRWLNNIRNTLASGELWYDCIDESICRPTTWAWIRGTRRVIHLCRRFWQWPPGVAAATLFQFQALALIHEASHLYYQTEDVLGTGPGVAECIAQFLAESNGSPINPGLRGRCGPANLPVP